MRRNLFTTTVLALGLLTFTGCDNETEMPPTEVAVSLNYSFVESGSMTRAGGEVYTDFYNKYVKTKILTPKNFNLTFKNVETGATTVINGEWSKNHSLKMLTGEYEVTGTSYPNQTSNNSFKGVDSVYLCFNEKINISPETESVNLTAQYDSYMLMFDKADKTSVKYYYKYNSSSSGSTISFKNIDNLYYAFFNKLWDTRSYINRLNIERPVGISTIDMNDMPFEKGKYYYFNDLSNSFDLPPMTSGN